MNKKLYVGNLSYSVTEGELEEHFAQIGTVVSAILITDRNTGRSKGFGFVEMETEELAEKAIAELNNKDLAGRNLNISEARPQRERSFGGGGYGGGDRRGGGRGGDRYDRGGRDRY